MAADTTLVRVYHIETFCLVYIKSKDSAKCIPSGGKRLLVSSAREPQIWKWGVDESLWNSDRVSWLLNSSSLHILRPLHDLEPLCRSSSSSSRMRRSPSLSLSLSR